MSSHVFQQEIQTICTGRYVETSCRELITTVPYASYLHIRALWLSVIRESRVITFGKKNNIFTHTLLNTEFYINRKLNFIA